MVRKPGTHSRVLLHLPMEAVNLQPSQGRPLATQQAQLTESVTMYQKGKSHLTPGENKLQRQMPRLLQCVHHHTWKQDGEPPTTKGPLPAGKRPPQARPRIEHRHRDRREPSCPGLGVHAPGEGSRHGAQEELGHSPLAFRSARCCRCHCTLCLFTQRKVYIQTTSGTRASGPPSAHGHGAHASGGYSPVWSPCSMRENASDSGRRAVSKGARQGANPSHTRPPFRRRLPANTVLTHWLCLPTFHRSKAPSPLPTPST